MKLIIEIEDKAYRMIKDNNLPIYCFNEAVYAVERGMPMSDDLISRKDLLNRINLAEDNFKADNAETIFSGDGDSFCDGVLSGVFNIREMVMQATPITQDNKEYHKGE